MMKRNSGVCFLLLACVLFPAALAAKSQRLLYYLPGDGAWESLSAHIQEISILGPQIFVASGDGRITGAVEEKVRSLAIRHKVRLMPLLVNENFDSQVAHNILTNEPVRQRVIADSIRLCKANRCWGLQLDFEGISLADAKDLTAFIGEAGEKFHKNGMRFSVAVPAPLLGTPVPADGKRPLAGGFSPSHSPYDLTAISRSSDFISLMTYDHYNQNTDPGPIAGFAWVEQNVRYALGLVPPKKLYLGLGFYAREWCDRESSDSTSPEAAALARKAGAVIHWDPMHRSPWFEFYQLECRDVVWFENQRSLQEKMKLVKQYHLAGFAAWRLGQEDPGFWTDGNR